MKKLGEFLTKKKNIIKDAINFGKNCPVERINLTENIESINNLDKLVEIVKDFRTNDYINDTNAWQTSVTLGVLFGEMINKKHKYTWVLNSKKIPVITKSNKQKLSPINKIYDYILGKSEQLPSQVYQEFIK